MPNFNDLPKNVRKEIYRLHLCYEEPITLSEHTKIVQYTYGGSEHRSMPPIMQLSRMIEKEAAPFYYSQNHFLAENVSEMWWSFLYRTWPRHARLIRKVTVTWKATTTYASEGFKNVGRLKGLQELYIRVDEKAMLKRMLWRRSAWQRTGWDDPSPQQQLQILHYPGMAGLEALSGIPLVKFAKFIDGKGEESGGPIPGGVLETEIAPKLMARKLKAKPRRPKQDGFPFLSLSPELRNRIYDMLLRFDGPLQPSPRPPTSASTTHARRQESEVPDSALSILAVNRQIHDEACGIFYHFHPFVFHYSIHMHGFLQSLGPQRQTFIRDITVHYADLRSGGMSMTDFTFQLLKRCTGLRKLEIIMHGELFGKIIKQFYQAKASMRSANPAMLPGMKVLFELRGIADIKVRDERLESRIEDLRKEAVYPKYAAGTREACAIKLEKALQHFNTALADAQKGRVNHLILEDNQWQTWDDFPELKDDPRRSPEL